VVRHVPLLLLLTALFGCNAEAPLRTQLMLVAATDIERLDRVQFTVEAKGKETQKASAVHGKDAPGPHFLGLLYTGGSLGPVTLTATGFVGEKAVVSRVARTSFVEGKTRVVPLHLMARCENDREPCDPDKTCTERGCESPELLPGDLSDWDGSPPSYTDAGGVRSDGGGMGRIDAGDANNGGQDGGGSNQTGGPDGGVRDAGLVDGGGSPTVDAAVVQCDGAPTDLSSDPMHCGACDNVCTAPPPQFHAENRCVASQCKPRCLEGWGSCDGMLSNGCETRLLEIAHCGMCNRRCVGNRMCVAGVCIK